MVMRMEWVLTGRSGHARKKRANCQVAAIRPPRATIRRECTQIVSTVANRSAAPGLRAAVLLLRQRA